MAEYQEVIHNWRRMCNAVQDSNMGKMGHGWCDNCPIKNECWSNRAVASVAERCMLGVEPIIQKWAAEHPELIYPSWGEWLLEHGVVGAGTETRKGFTYQVVNEKFFTRIDADTARKLGIEPKEA